MNKKIINVEVYDDFLSNYRKGDLTDKDFIKLDLYNLIELYRTNKDFFNSCVEELEFDLFIKNELGDNLDFILEQVKRITNNFYNFHKSN